MFLKNLYPTFEFFLIGMAIFVLLSSNIFAQCQQITKIDTKLKFGEGSDAPIVQAWRYGNLATIVLVPGVNVNVDGSPRAYSVGNQGLADIQNGATIFDNGKYLDYSDYEEKYHTGFASLWVEAEKKGFGVGTRQFNAFALYSSDGNSIVGNGKGIPKTQQVAGESISYYISMTSPKSQQDGFPENDQRRYFDSGEISAFVVPGLPKKNKPTDPLTLLLGERQLAWS